MKDIFGILLARILTEASNPIVPSNGEYDGSDKFEAGKKTYDSAIKSVLASTEKMPRGEIKSLVKTD